MGGGSVGAVVGIGDLRSHNLAASQDILSVGAVLTFELVDISIGPIFLTFKLKPLLQDV